MKTIARFSIDKRWYIIAGWIAFVALTQIILGVLDGSAYKDTFSLPGTETDKVMHLLDKTGHADQNGPSGQVVLHAKSGTLATAPAGASTAFAALCSEHLGVVAVATPWQTVTCADGQAVTGVRQPTLLSADKTIAIADVSWKSANYDQKLFDGVYDHLSKLRSDTLQVEFTGDPFQGHDQQDSGVPPALLGFLAALVILAIVFRTVGATALPLASAAAALTVGLGLIAMLGLTALGVSFFYGMAVGTAIAVSLTMLAALTLLPALLSFLGLRVLRRKERRAVLAGNFVDVETVGFWARWSELVARRRVAFGVVGAVTVVALAIPFLALRLGHADQGNDPADTTTRKGYDLIAQGFGVGYNSTLTLVVSGPQVQQTAEQVAAAVARVPNVDTRSIFVPTQGLREQLSLVSLKSLSAPQH